MSLNNWKRPAGDSRYHAVITEQPTGSTVTRCHGRWPFSMEHEASDDPPIPERCRACLRALVNATAGGMSGVVQFDLSSVDD